MSTVCQRLFHRKCQRRWVGDQKKAISCQRCLWPTPKPAILPFPPHSDDILVCFRSIVFQKLTLKDLKVHNPNDFNACSSVLVGSIFVCVTVIVCVHLMPP